MSGKGYDTQTKKKDKNERFYFIVLCKITDESKHRINSDLFSSSRLTRRVGVASTYFYVGKETDFRSKSLYTKNFNGDRGFYVSTPLLTGTNLVNSFTTN